MNKNRGDRHQDSQPSLAITRSSLIVKHPLQEMNRADFGRDKKNDKELVPPVLKAAIDAEKTCGSIYDYLTQKTKNLAIVTLPPVKFPWRLRVGGIRGFREVLLPVFHPIYGIPYIPSSSLKGAVRAWALQNFDFAEVVGFLGHLDGKKGWMGRVQFLDAFPTKPCLSMDIANPQWHWQNDHSIKYKSEPHHLLSMEEPELMIGLASTNKGDEDDVKIVKTWLEKTLEFSGIGSRVSAGYGKKSLVANAPYTNTYEFQLWTQGMYGADTQKAEFRPTAVRGMLRYWFRVIALGLYCHEKCKEIEATFFGTIDPIAKPGSIRISIESKETDKGSNNHPYCYEGQILIESHEQKHLHLIEKILELSAYIGGIGRGSRRPLHFNSDRMRGCQWEIVGKEIPYDKKDWQDFIEAVIKEFTNLYPQCVPGAGDPGDPEHRCQDVLNHHARIYLLPYAELTHPVDVENWQEEGNKPEVRGRALEMLYHRDRNNIFPFKGEVEIKDSAGNLLKKEGNKNIGGKMETPSYVIIKSNFPSEKRAYQAITIFGANNSDREIFVNELKKLKGAILVYPLTDNNQA